jgi:hypothetical protein
LGEQAERGHKISSQVIERVKTMETSAAGIVRALGEIDRIAFGSKLVALNGKVEAAYFGEQGAAFGVVAHEISSHARRSEEITDRLMGEMQQLRGGNLPRVARNGADERRNAGSQPRGIGPRTRRANAHTYRKMESTLESSVRQGRQLADKISRSITPLQFQDRVAQCLGHVADQLAGMRKTIHLSLEILTNETSVLGEARRKEVGERLDARYTMQAECEIDMDSLDLSPEPAVVESNVGGVELF